MKQQIISEVVQQMLPHLDNAQMQQLQKVLENTLFGCEITAQTEKSDTDNNPKLDKILRILSIVTRLDWFLP